ncbi:hypothetical protein Tco_0906027 [Tanacetum coccineum]
MQSELWPEIRKGIDQHLGKIYTDSKSTLKRDYWVKNPDDETYDVEAIRSRRLAKSLWKIGMNRSGFGLIPRTWPSVLKMLETGQRAQSHAGRDPGHLLPSEIGSSATQEYMSLIQTFFDTYTVGVEEMLRLQGLGTYTDDQIMAKVRWGKQRGHILCVGRVLAGRGKDVLDVPVPRCNHTFDVNELKKCNKQLQKQIDMITKAMSSDNMYSQLFTQLQSQHESESGSGSGAAEDDESGNDEDADEDEEDADS